MSAAKGNQYAAKERLWAKAIDIALDSRGGQLGRMGAMVELAHVLLSKANEGDLAALKELGDRMDGKSRQQVDLGNGDDSGLKINVVTYARNNSP